MDTGLNNRNTLHLALKNPYMEDVEWMIEATTEEKFQLWRDYDEKFDWKDARFSHSYSILQLETIPKIVLGKPTSIATKKAKKESLPVYIEFDYAIINGHKVCFYTSNSCLSHYGYIDAFLITYFQRTHHNYSRWNHTNATNFHNCINYLDTIDIVPRDTKHKPDEGMKKYHIFKKINIK
jgi:hypothetical protein